MNAYAVFFVAFRDEFGWSRADTALGFAVSQLVNGASSPVVGALVDRVGVLFRGHASGRSSA